MTPRALDHEQQTLKLVCLEGQTAAIPHRNGREEAKREKKTHARLAPLTDTQKT